MMATRISSELPFIVCQDKAVELLRSHACLYSVKKGLSPVLFSGKVTCPLFS